ncbi:hypothetical protein ACLB2K_035600 [Fragaria x ananassa]
MRTKWKAPTHGMFKLNCDASVGSNGEWVGLGGVVCGSDGNLLMAFGERVAGRYSPYVAELQAIIQGLEMLVDRGWTHVIVESDCTEAVSMINGDMKRVLLLLINGYVLIEKAKLFLESLGLECIFFVLRDGNGVAHEIANKVAWLEGRHVWLGVEPD